METTHINGSPAAIAAIGELPDAFQIEALQQFNFTAKVATRQVLIEQRDSIDRILRGINEELATALTVADIKAVRAGNFRVTRVDGRGPSSIKKELLIEKGVAADIIVAATVEGKPYTTVQVRPIEQTR